MEIFQFTGEESCPGGSSVHEIVLRHLGGDSKDAVVPMGGGMEGGVGREEPPLLLQENPYDLLPVDDVKFECGEE